MIFLFHEGKRNNAQRPAEHGLGYQVVTKLVEPYYGKHHHVVIDNGFTSPVLAKELYENDTYVTGTVRDTRKHMPKTFKRMKVAKGDRVVRQSGQIIAMKYGDRKTVTLLSTKYLPRYKCHQILIKFVKYLMVLKIRLLLSNVHLLHILSIFLIT